MVAKANLNRRSGKGPRPRNATVGTCPRCEKGRRRNQEKCTLCDGDGWVWVSKD